MCRMFRILVEAGPGAVALVIAVSFLVGVVPNPAHAQTAPCSYENRTVPHGTIIGVMRCQNGRWVRI